MRNISSALVMIALSATLAVAAPPQEAAVQGLYEGVWKDAGGSLPAEVRIVALGNKKFALMARRKLPDGTIERAEIPGKIDGEQVAFAGEMGGAAWKATYVDGTIKGSMGDKGTLEIKRIERKPPSLGKKPRAGIDGCRAACQAPSEGFALPSPSRKLLECQQVVTILRKSTILL